ncbi:MAG: glycosyltransferase family 4 protein, partial [Ktedonobacterales bacterium]
SPLVHLAMVPWMVAGIKTHYLNVRAVAEALPEIALSRFEVNPYIVGGNIERIPLLPNRVKANLRCQLSSAPLLNVAPLDVVWTQTLTSTIPFLFTRGAFRHIPVVYDIDTTPQLLAAFGSHYAAQVTGPSFKRRVVDALHRQALSKVALVVPWSAWAARSFVQDYGVSEDRICIIPPGVHLEEWAPPADAQRAGHAEKPQLLFVGADFERKGGDLLLEVYRQHFAGRCELHLVTKAPIAAEPGVHVYREFTPNDPALRHLYHTSDALVLPTQADCFSLASIEAMAAELPVITTAVGGIPEIIADSESGYLIKPHDGIGLRTALDALLADSSRRHAMGARGRAIAEQRFDASQNARRLLDHVYDLARPHAAEHSKKATRKV